MHGMYNISAEVKERVELYLFPPLWAFVDCSKANFTFMYIIKLTFRNLASYI